MLVLTRRVGDAVICRTGAGEEIEIKVLRIGAGGQVRIGIEAPRDCSVLRQELEVRWDLADQAPVAEAATA